VKEPKNSEKGVHIYCDAYKRMFTQAIDALMIIDGKTGSVLVTNEAATELFGYSSDDLEGMHFSTLFPEESKVQGLDGENGIVNYDGVFIQEFRLADGSRRMMDFTITMIPWHLHTAIFATFRDATSRIKAEEEKEKLIRDLKAAMERIKTLRGLLPICAHCKKVRDDKGYWQQVEVFVRDHSLAEFSHGICPDCLKEHYNDLIDEEDRS